MQRKSRYFTRSGSEAVTTPIDNSLHDKNAVMINGPINTLRLAGNVGGVDKVLYMFIGINYPETAESECKNMFSVDLSEYLVKEMNQISKNKKIVDVFINMSQDVNYQNFFDSDKTMTYYKTFVKKFGKLLLGKSNQDLLEDVSVLDPEFNEKVRLHNYQIGQLFFNQYVYPYFTYARQLHPIEEYYNPLMINTLAAMSNRIKTVIDVLSFDFARNVPENILGYDVESNREHIDQLLAFTKKLREGYRDDNVKSYMNKMIDYVVFMFHKCLHKISVLDHYAREIYQGKPDNFRSVDAPYGYLPFNSSHDDVQKQLLTLNKKRNNVAEWLHSTTAAISQLYFLRRFLDAETITTAIIFVNVFDAIFPLEILLKHAGMTITNASYNPTQSIEILNEELKALPNIEYIKYLTPVNPEQCSNLTAFPKHFE
jgi:hypothetical protein